MQTKGVAHSWNEERKGENRSQCHKDGNKNKMPWEEKEKGKKMETKLTATSAYAVTEQKLSLLGFYWEM